jgi:hypothetical protein
MYGLKTDEKTRRFRKYVLLQALNGYNERNDRAMIC